MEELFDLAYLELEGDEQYLEDLADPVLSKLVIMATNMAIDVENVIPDGEYKVILPKKYASMNSIDILKAAVRKLIDTLLMGLHNRGFTAMRIEEKWYLPGEDGYSPHVNLLYSCKVTGVRDWYEGGICTIYVKDAMIRKEKYYVVVELVIRAGVLVDEYILDHWEERLEELGEI